MILVDASIRAADGCEDRRSLVRSREQELPIRARNAARRAVLAGSYFIRLFSLPAYEALARHLMNRHRRGFAGARPTLLILAVASDFR
ncbi:hypothetical protein [Mesorhizobium sp. B4-1-4]|uniref:hypothetical protein n=1 Tax=Mesorhizobium sp. B4-1-4 TaxID=2589888 RepID=UPI00112622B7|nr:hypothetical protein [Mesorhizobium sp. B4-1-4]UCI30367.1 hypothetical protein FJW03_21515 [Mesorhizobium sp. B4-1-4]